MTKCHQQNSQLNVCAIFWFESEFEAIEFQCNYRINAMCLSSGTFIYMKIPRSGLSVRMYGVRDGQYDSAAWIIHSAHFQRFFYSKMIIVK